MFDLHDPKNVKHVRNIFFKRFSIQTLKMGIDPEDMLQDIYLTLWSRNRPGTEFTPFNPERSAKSTYLIQVCRSTISHKRKYIKAGTRIPGDLLPIQVDGQDEEAPWMPYAREGDGGSAWERAAEEVGASVERLARYMEHGAGEPSCRDGELQACLDYHRAAGGWVPAARKKKGGDPLPGLRGGHLPEDQFDPGQS